MKVRLIVGTMTLSAAGLIAIVSQEGYTDKAVVPTKNDRPTYGFGSTFKEDGSPVRIGDRTDPVRALRTVQAHLSREENLFRQSLPGVSLTQDEYDLYMDWVYQYGIDAWMKSSMRRELLAGNYKKACDALLLYRYSGGYDCSTMINGERNKRCWGVWERQQKRHAACQAEQV